MENTLNGLSVIQFYVLDFGEDGYNNASYFYFPSYMDLILSVFF